MWQLKFLSYLIQVSLVLTAFSLIYRLFLKNLTYLGLSRLYLITTVILIFLIPSLKLILPENIAGLPTASGVYEKAEEFTDISSSIINAERSAVSWIDITFYFYCIIASFLLLRLLASAITVCKYTGQAVKDFRGLKIIYKSDGFANCSFFNCVFINPSTLSQE